MKSGTNKGDRTEKMCTNTSLSKSEHQENRGGLGEFKFSDFHQVDVQKNKTGVVKNTKKHEMVAFT